MTEVTWTACHAASLVPSRGKGLKLLGIDANIETDETLTTGLTEISGIGYMVEDADMDANTPVVMCQISGGTVTFEVGDFTDYTDVVNDVRLLVMGIVR